MGNVCVCNNSIAVVTNGGPNGALGKQRTSGYKMPALPTHATGTLTAGSGPGTAGGLSGRFGSMGNIRGTGSRNSLSDPSGGDAFGFSHQSLNGIPDQVDYVEPADPEAIRRLIPFQANCLREQVVSYRRDRRQIEGAIAFVDISGFSALANTLGQSSKGAMILSQCINDYLTPLIRVVFECYGDIITFAGDAFIALWQTSARCTRHAPLLHATNCALALQEKYNVYTVPGTNVILRIHIGIAYGFFNGLTMSAGNRSLFLLTGRPMITIADAVDGAAAGQVCLTSAAGQLLADFIKGQKQSSGVVIVEKITINPLPAYSQPPISQWGMASHKQLECYLPKVLLEHLRSFESGGVSGAESTLALQRFVSVLFLGQPDLLYNDADKVQEFATAALRSVSNNGGEVLQVIQDDKGLHMIAVFGVRPNDTPAAPAVQSAQEMIISTEVNGNKRCRIGISTGKVFCGVVGSEQRRAFDILGDAVNLSCRLMQLCGETQQSFLCDEATQQNCAGRFMFRKMPQKYKMKGQKDELAVYCVEGNPEYENLGLDVLRRRLQVHSTTVCGRHQERAILDSAIRGILRQKPALESAASEAWVKMKQSENTSDSASDIPGINSRQPQGTDTKVYDFDEDEVDPSPGPTSSHIVPSIPSQATQSSGAGNMLGPPNFSRLASSASDSEVGGSVGRQMTRKPYFRLFSHISRSDVSGSIGLTARGDTVPVVYEDPMIVFEGHMGTGKSTIAVFMQNQWPLLPILVAVGSKHDRKPLAIFQRIFSSLFAWIRLYSAACNLHVTSETKDEDIIRKLAPHIGDFTLAALDPLLSTRFGRIESFEGLNSSGGAAAGNRENVKTPTPSTHPVSPPTSPAPPVATETMISVESSLPSASPMNLRHSPSFKGRGALINPTAVSKKSIAVGELNIQTAAWILFELLKNFCSRVPALVLCYDDSHHMDVHSQAMIEQLHSWAVDNHPQFLQVLFVEKGCVGILPNGSKRQEIGDLTLQDVREFLRTSFGDKIVESDMIPDALCHIIGRKVSYNALMMGELVKVIMEPRMLKHVKSNARGEAQIAPLALFEILEYDFAHSHAITQMVSHEFDGLDAPQQIVAKAAAVVLAHPEARLYRPQLYCLIKEFTPAQIDQYLDLLVARRIIVVDTSGQPLLEQWRIMPRYRFTLECFGSVLTSMMSPDTLIDMNKRLAMSILEMKVYMTPVNYDVLGFYLLHGEIYTEALKHLMGAIEFYIDDDELCASGVANDRFANANIYRAQALRFTVRALLERMSAILTQQGGGIQLLKNEERSEWKDLLEKVKVRFTKAAEKVDARLFGPQGGMAGDSGQDPVDVDQSGVVDLDASARRLTVLINRVEELCETRKQLNMPLWQQFLLVLEGYQRIQGAVVATANKELGTNADLRSEEINASIKRIETGKFPESLHELRALTAHLTTSITAATNAAKGVLALPMAPSEFVWKDSFLIHIAMIDHQHKQLFVIIKRIADVATSKEMKDKQSEMGKVLKWLLEYVLFHFLAEESLQRRVGYPQFPQHQSVHQMFTQQCLTYQAQFTDNTLVVDEKLASRLWQWLVVHIGNSDNHFSKYYFTQDTQAAAAAPSATTNNQQAKPQASKPPLARGAS